ncbi:MAG: primosomal protein N', partial [Candidatus Omnitrophota bacterium]
AQVVFNLPIEGPFDYLIPPGREQNIMPGIRVGVSFGRRCCIGYVVGKVKYTPAKKIKPILKIIDDVPVLNKTMLRITRQMADYYACSWGEAIETALPVDLRKGRKIALQGIRECSIKGQKPEILLLHDLRGQRGREVYFQEIHKAFSAGKGVIFLTPDIRSAALMQKEVKDRLNLGVGLLHSHQPQKEELRQWIELKEGKLKIVVGTRLAIFAPLSNLGLIIIEGEENPFYKQDSVPHYNAVGLAEIRARIEGVRLILSSRSPSLEAWYQAKKGKIKYIFKEAGINTRQIAVIDLQRAGFVPQRRKMRLSIALEDAIKQTLSQKARVLLFLNRRGFAIFSHCQNCDTVLRCPRCSKNLILHFKSSRLICHQCNYSIVSPRICPNCNSGYIRYTGLGTEKLESELYRLYPQVNIARMDKDEEVISKDAQIIVATESIFKHKISDLGLIGVISPDTVLNRPDFRATERMFTLLLHLSCLTDNLLLIQTNFSQHYCFQALTQKNIELFYETELAFRRQSKLPPFTHIIIVKLRGRDEERVSSAAEELFNALEHANQDKSIKIVSFSKQISHKKRDRFYEQILIKTKSAPRAVNFIKKGLADFRRSGIIVTVDVDPI